MSEWKNEWKMALWESSAWSGPEALSLHFRDN